MAALASQGADIVWLTSDNPRSEDPGAIIADMRAGLTQANPQVHEHVDRAAAIHAAVAAAGDKDLVLIAGKGHEDYQEIKGVRLPFDDALVVADALRDRSLADISPSEQAKKEQT